MSTATDWQNLLQLVRPSDTEREPLSPAAWEGVLSLAQRHRLLPLLHYHHHAAPEVPPQVRAALRHAFLVQTYTNTQIFDQLRRLLDATAAAGIPVMLLKGACLAELVYADLALRPMGDVDLLVRREAVPQAYAVSRALNYAVAADVVLAPTAPNETSPLQHTPRVSRDRGLAIEWHWTILSGSEARPGVVGQELEDLWTRSRPAPLGAATRMLSPEDLLLHTCSHAASFHHLGSQTLLACCDLVAILGKHGADLDWAQVRQRAETWRVRHGVALVLQLAHRWLGAALPEDVLAWTRETVTDETVMAWVEARMVEPAPSFRLHTHLPDTLNTPGLRGKLGYLTRSFFPSPEALAASGRPVLTRWQRLCACPSHFRRLWQRHGATLWRLARRDPETTRLLEREAALRAWLNQG